ncbi:MAG: hypothetical protein E5V64_06540 [Mesorhizobium sp.]|uniref:hypothetical protein n=1 Tax=Mesorhizobium sp. TaxID=1871066 RepID=UPI001210514C|nr:hypothetical protein [Mesorhizobium sp.]TIV83817.1 MAG: hypothetical protein E5V64_06540 [Mesorhizobium sp.]
MRIDLAEMHRAADRVAARAEATSVKEQAALTAEIEFAKANKQAVTGSHWKAAYVAGEKARAARAVADALAEVASDA